MPGWTDLLSDADKAGVWRLSPERSKITAKARSFWGLLPVTVRFTDISGDGQITAAGEVFGRVDLRAASLSSGISKRDHHLRSADFFHVERYPELSVVVTAAKPGPGNTADLRAKLTVAGTTRPVTLPATVSVLGDGAVQVAARTTIRRDEFGVDGNLLGMIPKATKLVGDVVFVRAT